MRSLRLANLGSLRTLEFAAVLATVATEVGCSIAEAELAAADVQGTNIGCAIFTAFWSSIAVGDTAIATKLGAESTPRHISQSRLSIMDVVVGYL
jgi:hypothetical protein